MYAFITCCQSMKFKLSHMGGGSRRSLYVCICIFFPLAVILGKLQTHKWENAMTIDHYSWGYRRNAPLSNYLSIEELLKTFITTVSCGGNMLMNVGPTSYGRIVPIMEERLKQMGEWLGVNGEAIYGTRPWSHQNDTVTKDVW